MTQQFYFWEYIQETWNINQKNICIPMFIAVLFTIANLWKQPKCPSVDEWIEKAVVPLHNGILLSQKEKKERHLTFCDSTDGPGEYYAKWNRPVRERKTITIWFHLYVESNKQNKLTNEVETLINTENQLTALRGQGVGGWIKKVKRWSKGKRNPIDTDNSMVAARRKEG